MRQLNRKSLASFLKQHNQMDDVAMDNGSASDSDEETWNDECIDEEIRQLLGKAENGKEITLDIVAHMEYFYNTLECHHKVVNPFECVNPLMFPALHCHMNDQAAHKTGFKSLFQQHRTLIYPNSPAMKTQSQSGSLKESSKEQTNSLSASKISSSLDSDVVSQQAIVDHLLPKQYRWYPNIKI